jgi:FkbM family methyltransferase
VMSYRRVLVRLLDHPGGRLVLGKIATRVAQRAEGDDVEITYVNGLWMHRAGPYFLPDGVGFDYTYSDFKVWKRQVEQYAEDTREYWLQHYRPQEGDVIVDVGAGRGEDTLTFSRGVGKTGRVLAIEAHPLSFAILKSFCRLNGLSNVTLLHLALMDKPGTVRIVESESSWMENAVEYDNGSPGNQVKADTFSHICERHGLNDVAFLKMNIEGAERYALLGMESVVPRVRQMCVACHDFRSDLGHGEQFRTRAFVERYLTDHGFTVAGRPDHPDGAIRNHVFGLRPGEL